MTRRSNFEVTVKSVDELVQPEYTDEFVSDTLGYESKEAFETALRDELDAGYQEQSRDETRENAIIAAMDGCEFNGYPDKLYDTCEASVSETYTSFADSYGMSVEELYDAYGMTQEDVDAEIMDTVNRRLFISAICQAEDITVTSDEYTAFLESLYPDYGYDDAESFETDYGKDYLMWYLYENKVADYLVNNASLYESPVSMDAEDLEVYDEDTESETDGDTLEGLDDADAEEEYVTETVTEEDDLTEEETEAES